MPEHLVRCPACGSSHLSRLIDLDDVPIHCNVPQRSQSDAQNAARGEIRLCFCRDCGHLHNTTFNPELLQYGPGYENSLDFSPRFREYTHTLAERLVEQYNLRGRNIIEIACGRGEFLKSLCTLGSNCGIGFDPSHVSHESRREDITFIRDFYSERYSGYAADFICCRHALEHIQYPRDFLRDIRRAIGDRLDTVLFFEVPNSLYTLEDLGIWDLIYEHCSYFCSTSLAQVFEASGFTVREVGTEYDGQFLTIIAQPIELNRRTSVAKWANGRTPLAHVASFKTNYHKKLGYWSHTMNNLLDAGERVVIWGAGSKGATFLNVLKEVARSIDYVIDVNPHKQGMHLAGAGQRIMPPGFVKEYQPDYVIAMNPAYEDEILSMLNSMNVNSQVLVA